MIGVNVKVYEESSFLNELKQNLHKYTSNSISVVGVYGAVSDTCIFNLHGEGFYTFTHNLHVLCSYC